jgi:hypothetical protein
MQNDSSSVYAPSKRSEKRIKTIRSIYQISRVAAVIHFVCLCIAFFLWVQNRDKRNAVYEMYRPAFVPDSNLTTVIQNQLVESCPRAALTVLTLQAEFPVPESASILSIRGAWLAVRTTPFGFVHMNGYHLLFVIFGVSFLAQLNVVFEFRKSKKTEDYDFFMQPCAARWFEYAITSPCMISVIAASLAIRDVNTILLLAAAQGALCQFGFAMECAFELRKCEPNEFQPPPKHIEFRPFPVVPLLRTIPNMSHQLWYWSFVPSMLLHVLVWGVLLSSFADQQGTRCADGDGKMPDWIVAILAAQGVLFTLFVVVAVLQSWKLDMVPFRVRKAIEPEDVQDSFVDAFWYYTILSAVAKAVLGMTYVSYVNQFPLYTPL